jgi:hypothetical protein
LSPAPPPSFLLLYYHNHVQKFSFLLLYFLDITERVKYFLLSGAFVRRNMVALSGIDLLYQHRVRLGL